MMLFQFHKGTIKTQTSLNKTIEGLNNFNSIKVRLKLEYDVKEHGILIFQFHKGTIKTGVSIDLPQCAQISIP